MFLGAVFLIVIMDVPTNWRTHDIHEKRKSAKAPRGKGYTRKCTSSSIGSGSPQRRLPEPFLFLAYTM